MKNFNNFARKPNLNQSYTIIIRAYPLINRIHKILNHRAEIFKMISNTNNHIN